MFTQLALYEAKLAFGALSKFILNKHRSRSMLDFTVINGFNWLIKKGTASRNFYPDLKISGVKKIIIHHYRFFFGDINVKTIKSDCCKYAQ